MDTRIGAARPLWQYFFTCDPSNGRGQGPLNAGCIRLHLPTAERSSVISQDDFQVSHEKRNLAEYQRIQHVYSRLHERKLYSAILFGSRAQTHFSRIPPGSSKQRNSERLFCVIQICWG